MVDGCLLRIAIWETLSEQLTVKINKKNILGGAISISQRLQAGNEWGGRGVKGRPRELHCGVRHSTGNELWGLCLPGM